MNVQTTKYPILLVHGIVFKESRVFKAFGKIGKTLEKNGFRVYVATHDGFGTIASNAGQLAAQIEKISEKERTQKINIIAHSKGGLDCKYLINELRMEDKIASLTTLCTPHRGSPVASAIWKLPKFMLKFIAFWLDFWYRIFGDKYPDSYSVCRELLLREGDDLVGFSDKVYCQSFSSNLKKYRDDFLMSIPLKVSRMMQKGDTDGLVPVDSTKFADYRGNCIDGSISHSQIVGFTTSKKKKEQVCSFYLSLCNELAAMGF